MDHMIILMLSAAVSLDAAAAGAALGSAGIRLPKLSALIISGAGALCLLIPALCGDLITAVIPMEICRTAARILLAAVGIAAIIGWADGLRRKSHDCSAADKNCDRVLSSGEASALALGLSADCAVTGLSAGLSGTDAGSAAMLFFSALIMGYTAVTAGRFFGARVLSGGRFDFGWLSGAVLIVLSFLI